MPAREINAEALKQMPYQPLEMKYLHRPSPKPQEFFWTTSRYFIPDEAPTTAENARKRYLDWFDSHIYTLGRKHLFNWKIELDAQWIGDIIPDNLTKEWEALMFGEEVDR